MENKSINYQSTDTLNTNEIFEQAVEGMVYILLNAHNMGIDLTELIYAVTERVGIITEEMR